MDDEGVIVYHRSTVFAAAEEHAAERKERMGSLELEMEERRAERDDR